MMKKEFREYHQFTKIELENLCKECIFVLDTNVLLDMYRMSKSSRKKYFSILQDLKSENRIWIPYQVGYEFYENRIDVINDLEQSYETIISDINSEHKAFSTYGDHPVLDIEEIKLEIEKAKKTIIEKIKKQKKSHPKWKEKDDVLIDLQALFEGNTGSIFNEEELKKIIDEGKVRYENKIPPGYKDSQKDKNKFGDLLVWKEILLKSKQENKPIIFLSRDVKEDWWLEKSGKKIMPRPELKKEMLDTSGMDFHIYTPTAFLENMGQDGEILDEVKSINNFYNKYIKSEKIINQEYKSNKFNNYYNSIDHIYPIGSIGSDEINSIIIDTLSIIEEIDLLKFSGFINPKISDILVDERVTLRELLKIRKHSVLDFNIILKSVTLLLNSISGFAEMNIEKTKYRSKYSSIIHKLKAIQSELKSYL